MSSEEDKPNWKAPSGSWMWQKPLSSTSFLQGVPARVLIPQDDKFAPRSKIFTIDIII